MTTTNSICAMGARSNGSAGPKLKTVFDKGQNMKSGKTIAELATEIDRQKNAKRDFIAPSKAIMMDYSKDRGIQMNLLGDNLIPLKVNHLAHQQIGEKVGIPSKYYDRMMVEAPELLTTNVNHWMRTDGEKRMVRTLDGTARAFLSDKYRAMDNYDLAQAVLPQLMPSEGVEIVSCEITEKRMYIKATTPRIAGEVKKGDVVQAGIVIRNSEVGCGALAIEPLILRLVCMNGLIVADATMRKFHVGKVNATGDAVMEHFTQGTRNQTDKALWMQVRDLVKAGLSNAIFGAQLEKMKVMAGTKIEAAPDKVVEVLATRFQMSENEQGNVLKHLIEGADLSTFGYMNAVTAASQVIEDYERATDFERIGGEIVEMGQKDWSKVVEAAA